MNWNSGKALHLSRVKTDQQVHLQKHVHYIFINPKSKKVLLKGNIFGIEIPISHFEYIEKTQNDVDSAKSERSANPFNKFIVVPLQ